ncbi:hypothetical protein ACFOQM_11945 [Paenibacillus sp. GCM10012307]|uniref:Uncharacterized protein n=1 Tax=Paenibacillus roseus TaxID=2798579 RepID=A0A934MR53_9BACL|nr:hypothetical protein [Paenibacillus roseus]MBJ6362004.1 hypothetical protein [Paenibacillus roseus]
MEHYQKGYEMIQTIPDVSGTTTANLIAKDGVDMGQFATPITWCMGKSGSWQP